MFIIHIYIYIEKIYPIYIYIHTYILLTLDNPSCCSPSPAGSHLSLGRPYRRTRGPGHGENVHVPNVAYFD